MCFPGKKDVVGKLHQVTEPNIPELGGSHWNEISSLLKKKGENADNLGIIPSHASGHQNLCFIFSGAGIPKQNLHLPWGGGPYPVVAMPSKVILIEDELPYTNPCASLNQSINQSIHPSICLPTPLYLQRQNPTSPLWVLFFSEEKRPWFRKRFGVQKSGDPNHPKPCGM